VEGFLVRLQEKIAKATMLSSEGERVLIHLLYPAADREPFLDPCRRFWAERAADLPHVALLLTCVSFETGVQDFMFVEDRPRRRGVARGVEGGAGVEGAGASDSGGDGEQGEELGEDDVTG
jgi:hypothetical protein